jgi:hypothetical protein
MSEVPSVAALAARADELARTAEALRAAFRRPAMQALVTEAVTNLREAHRWLGDARLQSSQDCRMWVDGILRIAARRLRPLEEALQTHGPDVTEPSA